MISLTLGIEISGTIRPVRGFLETPSPRATFQDWETTLAGTIKQLKVSLSRKNVHQPAEKSLIVNRNSEIGKRNQVSIFSG